MGRGPALKAIPAVKMGQGQTGVKVWRDGSAGQEPEGEKGMKMPSIFVL